MKELLKGTFLGITKIHFQWEGVTISETTYPAGLSSHWHYHQNPYFTLILNGGSIEERRGLRHECLPSQLLYYDFDEQHRNTHYQADSQNVNVEFDRNWLENKNMKLRSIKERGFIRIALLRALHECRINDSLSYLSVQHLVLECQADLENTLVKKNPQWVNKIREILWNRWDETPSLEELSKELNLHPITISRFFARYFNCSLGDYVRRLKVEKALELLKGSHSSLIEISMLCGFSDLSHFNRVFKSYIGYLPSEFRRQ